MAGLKADHHLQPKVIEILDSDDDDDDDSATDNSDRGNDSDVQLIIPAAHAAPVKSEAGSQTRQRIPTNSDSCKGKGKERAVEPLAGPSRSSISQTRYGIVENAYSEEDHIDSAGPSTRTRHNLVSSSNHSAGLTNIKDEDVDSAYARRLYEELNGTAYNEDDGQLPLLASSKRKRSSSSSSTPPPVESDSQLAARLAHEEELAEAHRKQLEESDALYAKTVYAADELAERIRREKLEKTGEKVEKIAYQVTMDGDGKTIEGDEDAENMNHLALVRNQFMAGGIANGLQILKVTYFVNFELNARFEAAKDALAQQGRDATERTLFHGTPQKNLQAILEDGFRVGGVDGRVVNGTAFGVGVYLATSPVTSIGYCQGSNMMFACRVVTGLTTATPQHGPPSPVGSNTFDAYDGRNGIVVARTSAQVLPRYLVEFHWDYMNQLARGLGFPSTAGLFGTSKGRAPRKAPKKARLGHLAASAMAAAQTGDSDPDDEPVQHRTDAMPGGFGRARANPLAGLAGAPMIDPVTMQPLDPAAAAARKRRSRR